ncbi:Sulfotransferase domain-containing protein [Kytococcus aerolatus]|uniref:Sulfotransferase domain-containing protein n=1 Tax=Kytococcus aerolatus TaxID=592308 RepID=A0A212T6S3_9MICO|nr:sulfotransferase domain-containing protein [Kytococcus aerolatus]SNC61728.1 Sulfotransferase domain-containing protein [Kytococcus aerolatus]
MDIESLQRQAGQALDEQMRRASAESTRRIALRFGSSLPMWIGCGFPKSGTVWLCDLMATYLGVPYPKNYRLPIAMSSVIHAHWPYDPRMPTTAYIARDGRDITVSTYFYYLRALSLDKSPARKHQLRDLFQHLYGDSFDPSDTQRNMPVFVEHILSRPRATRGLTWSQHILDWADRPQVHTTTYEALLRDTTTELSRLMGEMTGEEADPVRVRCAVDRHSFATATGRGGGQEDRRSFQRKGQAGDWRNHYTRETAEVFDSLAGDALVAMGYEQDRSWVDEVPVA